jgi:hypothetical protein
MSRMPSKLFKSQEKLSPIDGFSSITSKLKLFPNSIMRGTPPDRDMTLFRKKKILESSFFQIVIVQNLNNDNFENIIL